MGLIALPAIPPIVEGIIWLGVALGVTHQVAPGKAEREQSIRDLGSAMAGNDSAAMSNAQEDAQAKAAPGTSPRRAPPAVARRLSARNSLRT